jgi:hypothetical protein
MEFDGLHAYRACQHLPTGGRQAFSFTAAAVCGIQWCGTVERGLQSAGGPGQSLMSMPPQASWAYRRTEEPGSAEARLYSGLIQRDWVEQRVSDCARGPQRIGVFGGRV